MANTISDVVKITDRLIPQGTQLRELGQTLFLTTDDSVLDPVGSGKVKVYRNAEDVRGAFGSQHGAIRGRGGLLCAVSVPEATPHRAAQRLGHVCHHTGGGPWHAV